MLLLFFLCAVVILTLMISCFRVMLLSCNEFQWFRARPPSPFYESDTACEPRFQIATVLAHVCKMLASACHDEHIFEAHGTPNVTHTMVSTPFLCRRCDPRSLCSALGHPLRTMPDRQTLRVCSQIVRRSLRRLCRSSFPDASNHVLTRKRK